MGTPKIPSVPPNTNFTPNADIRKYLPEQFVNVQGRNTPGILNAINNSAYYTEALIQSCIDQLFITTASGTYLINLGVEQGFTMPANSGLDIQAYQKILPIMISDPKQVRQTLEALVQAFYGISFTNPTLQSGVVGPYSLADGDNLQIETEAGTVDITISASQVSDITNVSATELSAIINYSQSLVYSDTLTDRSTGKDYLRLIDSTPGQGAYIKIIGGTAQNIVQFPTLANTQCQTGTTFTLTKSYTYSDQLTFTWNGIGTNPNLYLVATNDYVTIRGLVDGAAPFSLLNGSYQIIDSGYDYFTINNSPFQTLTSTLVQNSDTNLIFSKNFNTTIFNNSQYAFLSETLNQTITVTVPAIPPITKRSLEGSAHLQGQYYQILGFTRDTVQIQIGMSYDTPLAVNKFFIANSNKRFNFKDEPFVTLNKDNNATQPTYVLDTSTAGNAVFPYTVATAVGNNPFYGEIGSSTITMNFPNYAHGLQYTWGFTLAGAMGAANVTSLELNQELQVYQVLNDNNIAFQINGSDGQPVVFSGIPWGASGSYPSVYQQNAQQADGSDFYLLFPTVMAAQQSGLTVGASFYLDGSGGTNVDGYLGNLLRFRKLQVESIVGNQVNFTSGIGIGSNGLIITDIYGLTSGAFGGSNTTYFFNSASTTNQSRVFQNLRALFVNRTPASNPNYVGAFIYDAAGLNTTVSPSRFVTGLTNEIFKGSNPTALIVNGLTAADGTDFPTNGQLVIGYGTSNFEGPINYQATVINGTMNQILIDPAYRFKLTHQAGEIVQYIYADVPYVPATDGSDYDVYITDPSLSRTTLFTLLDLLVAAGVFVNKNILYPQLTNASPSINPFA